jgi:hypothetical protein
MDIETVKVMSHIAKRNDSSVVGSCVTLQEVVDEIAENIRLESCCNDAA